MYKRLTYFLLILFTLGSCKNKDSASKTDELDTRFEIGAPVDFTAPVFYQTLTGIIGKDSVVMHFFRQGDMVSANYYPLHSGPTVFLIKDWGAENADSIYLMEQRSDATGLSPRLTLHISKDTISGQWISADEHMAVPIRLTASQDSLTMPFGGFTYLDSARYLKFRTDTPVLKARISLVQAAGPSEDGEWLNQAMKHLLPLPARESDQQAGLQEIARRLVQQKIDGYTSEVDSSLVGVSNKQEVHYFLNREYINSSNLLFNKNGYVVVSFFNYAYTGGAHGNYGTTMRCYDVRTKKQLQISNILNLDSLQLQALLESHYRAQYHVPAATPLSEILLVEHIAPNDNFYFSAHGLGFSYVPYELGPYAAGEIHIWIPFSELKGYLNPEFAKRMGV
ncbi:hypothetical protein GCM10027051_00380 [Niabella terrae]